MRLEDLLAQRDGILALAAQHGARRVRVFGSLARGEADEASDIDLLVEFEPGRSLLDQAALVLELQALLGRKADAVSERGLRPALKARVLR